MLNRRLEKLVEIGGCLPDYCDNRVKRSPGVPHGESFYVRRKNVTFCFSFSRVRGWGHLRTSVRVLVDRIHVLTMEQPDHISAFDPAGAKFKIEWEYESPSLHSIISGAAQDLIDRHEDKLARLAARDRRIEIEQQDELTTFKQKYGARSRKAAEPTMSDQLADLDRRINAAKQRLWA